MQHRIVSTRWFAALALAACGSGDAEELSLEDKTTYINGIEGMFEYSLDLPWRMEPRFDKDNRPFYDPVPITIAILDEDTNHYSQILDPSDPVPQRLGKFCGVTVASVDPAGDHGTREFFAPDALSWIEVTGPGDKSHTSYWDYDNPVDPIHRVCHPATEDCSHVLQVRDTSEWHAQLMLDRPGLPGAQPILELIAWVSKDEEDCSGRWLALRTYAQVNFARDPLPRFDDGWLYGDLHYHSQSTDNEGESGYAYRAVATTLATMGVDFVFATDHASDSRQIVDADIVSTSQQELRGLRDMNQRRWDAAQHYLHDADGANAEGATFAAGRPRLPRVFLGAEVDVMPEIAQRPASDDTNDPAWTVEYGNNLSWHMLGSDGLCEGWVIPQGCPVTDLFTPFADALGLTAFAVRDAQGLVEQILPGYNGHAIGRQHLVYLPRFRDQPGGFVGSRTTHYGGASRHLIEDDGVLDEIETKDGIAFLAHPLEKGGAGPGPGMLPYTQYQYEKIFAHPALAGLQLWNENNRVSSDSGDFGQTGYEFLSWHTGGHFLPGYNSGGFTFTPVKSLGGWGWSKEENPASGLHHGTVQWDRLLRWGLDLERTLGIGWLQEGEPRRLFMAGGSDAHGDFNYRREGYMTGPTKATDTAIAKVRNLVEVGEARGPCSAVDRKCYDLEGHAPGHSQDQVAAALAEGRFAITDGPALRMVVDRNDNEVIDANDYPMGAVVELFPGEQLPLLIEAKSTGEFGNIERVDLYIGVDSDPASCGEPGCAGTGETRSRTYAPVDHGVRGSHRDNVTHEIIPDVPANDCGNGVCQMADGYWLPAASARSQLRALPVDLVNGVWRVTIDPDAFPVTTTRDNRPTRFYVRAFVRTVPPCNALNPTGTFRTGCAARFAYSNPIWTLRVPFTPGSECPFSDRALDRDLDGIPDHCDQFPDQAGGGWTRLFGGVQVDLAAASAIDAGGNAYVVGSVQNNARFEGGTGALANLAASNHDGVLLKYTPTGQLVARTVLTGFGMQVVTDVAIVGPAIYITGMRKGATTVNPFPSTTSESQDVFVARVRLSDLTVEWVRYLDGSGDASARGIAGSTTGQIVVTGDFSGVLVPFLSSLPAEGASDCFVAFYAAATGQLQSVQLVQGPGTCAARDIVIDSAGRSTAAFTYSASVRISAAIARTTKGNDTAIVRYGSSATGYAVDWATYLGSPSATATEFGDTAVAQLALGNDGSVLAGGRFTGQLYATGTRWGGSATIAANAQSGDGYVVRLDDLGRLLTSPLPRMGGTGDDAITGLAVDGLGNVVLTGEYASSSINIAGAILQRESTARDSVVAWLAPGGTLRQLRHITTTGGLVHWGKLATTPSGDQTALAFSFAGTGRFDDRRSVTALGDADGAITVLPGPQ